MASRARRAGSLPPLRVDVGWGGRTPASCPDGFANTRIASEGQVSPATGAAWRRRFAEDGSENCSGAWAEAVLPGWDGRGERPADVGRDPSWRTHWTCRSMAGRVKRVGCRGRPCSGSNLRMACGPIVWRPSATHLSPQSNCSSQSRLRHPGPPEPTVLVLPPAPGFDDPAPSRSGRLLVAEPDQLLAGVIHPNSNVRAVDEVVELPPGIAVHRQPLPVDPQHHVELSFAAPPRTASWLSARSHASRISITPSDSFARGVDALSSSNQQRGNRSIQEGRWGETMAAPERDPRRSWRLLTVAAGLWFSLRPGGPAPAAVEKGQTAF